MNFQDEQNQPSEVFSSVPASAPRWKRILDISIALLAMPLAVPLAAFVAFLIRLVSEGPVLFKQERIGYLGQRFMCFKFRTMLVGADTAAHQGHLHRLMDSNIPMTKMDSAGDPRIIPLGRLLRSTGLDELPQLINVFRGEMSLVGPRPCLAYEYDRYLPWQRERFTTLPGLTGLWQVSGKNRTTFVEMIQLDIKYARTKTAWQDLEIILRTIPALVLQVWETRQRKRMASPVHSEAIWSRRNAMIQSYSLRKPVIAEVVRAERHGQASGEEIKNKL
jgi:lipopolysaccharide/colanic/teichoic acid biosynthesis glycosyltransferase